MSDPSSNPKRKDVNQPEGHERGQKDDSSKMMDPLDLVYSGGVDRDPQEIISNPAVAPQTLSDGRDLRVDLFKDPDEADPNPPTEVGDPNAER